MLTGVAHWLTPPIFVDADKTRRAAVLNVALLTAIGLICLVMVGNLLGGKTPAAVMIIDVLIFGLSLLLRLWLKRGHLRQSAIGFLTLSLASIIAVCAGLGTIRTPTTAAFMLVVVMGGLLFDARGLVVMTALCSVSVLGLIVTEQAGLLPPPDYTVTITQWISYTVFFAWLSSLTATSLYVMRQALVQAQREVLERKRMEESERGQRTFSEALQAAAAAMTSTLQLDEVLDRILIQASRVVTCDAAVVYQFDGATAQAVRCHAADQRYALDLTALRFDTRVVHTFSEILAVRRPLVISDTRVWSEWVRIPATEWIRSYVGAPLQVRGQILGILEMDSTTPNFYDAIAAMRLSAFADAAAVAIENARLFAEAQRYADELEERVAERTQALAVAYERLQELDRLKSKFVSDVSHELRTPVTSLSLYLELMTQGKSEKQAHYLQQATSQMTRLRNLIDDILDLSRMERERPALNLAVHNLSEIVALVLDEQQPVAEAAGLELHGSLATSPLMVQVDHGQVLRAIRNLVTNAIKYTQAGQVLVTTLSAGLRVGVLVRDAGMGIAPEDLPHVFERFYRGKHVAQSTIAGTGLGLAIVRESIEAHGGTVEVESQVGVGSTFRVWLPAVIG